jgi:anthranilate phosphoribosyltransferase
MSEPVTFPEVFSEIVSEAGLSGKMARRAFDTILSGAWSPVLVASFISSLRVRGESAEVIAEAASSMRAAMVRVDHDFPLVLDTCGTGGDGKGTLNLSTAAAIIAAADGLVVAKHGNRAVSSKAGSADVLAALGIPLELPPATAKTLLERANIAFLIAPAFHPAMRHAMPARKELGVRTIFNCLGPLCNPAQATHQIIGAFSDELLPIMAETLKKLGTKRAWVVRGEDGLDEVSPYAKTRVFELDSGSIKERSVEPEDFGIAKSPEGAAAGGDASENAQALLSIFKGEPHPARDAVVLNAAAALVVARGIEPKEAARIASEHLSSGRALAALDAWRSAAQALLSS